MWRPSFIVGGSDEHFRIGESVVSICIVEENPLTSTSISVARVSFIANKDLHRFLSGRVELPHLLQTGCLACFS